jgi:ABC-type polysaccharide/polyol phosphate export permease
MVRNRAELQTEHDSGAVQWRADAVVAPWKWARGWVRYHPLFLELVRRNVKVRYVQSVLGLYWALINPLVTTAVLSIVFSVIIRAQVEGAPYFLFLLAGLLGWNFFANAVSDATQSLLAYSNLLGKVPFPREVLPSGFVAARLVDFAGSLLVLLVLVVLFYPQGLGPTALWLPVLLAVQFIFALGVGFIASTANLFYRDVQQLVQLLLMLGFFLTPVLYPIGLLLERSQTFYLLNPVAAVIDGYRRVLLEHRSPDWAAVGIATGIWLGALLVGYWLVKRQEPLFAERV